MKHGGNSLNPDSESLENLDLTQIIKRFPPFVLLIFILSNSRLFGTPLVGRIPVSDKNMNILLGRARIIRLRKFTPVSSGHRPHAASACAITIIKGGNNPQPPHNNFAREKTLLFPTARFGDLDAQQYRDNHTTPHPLSF